VLGKISIARPRYNFNSDNIFVIGGGQIYKYFLEHDLIDTIYLTTIYHEYTGDTHIPNLYELGFKETSVIIPKTTNDNGITYGISVLKK
jgi:dihydrofolate reductase